MPPHPPQPEGLRRSISRVSSRVGLRFKETFASSPPSRSSSRSRNDVQPKLNALKHVLSESNFDQPLPFITPDVEITEFDFTRGAEPLDSPDDLLRVPAPKGLVFRFEASRPSRSQSPAPFTSFLSADSVPGLHSGQFPVPRVSGDTVPTTLEPERAVETSTPITIESQRSDPFTSSSGGSVSVVSGARDLGESASPTSPASGPHVAPTSASHAAEGLVITAPEPQIVLEPQGSTTGPALDEIPPMISPEPPRLAPAPSLTVQASAQATSDASTIVPEAQSPAAGPVSDSPVIEIPATNTLEPQRLIPTLSPIIHALAQATDDSFITVPEAQDSATSPASDLHAMLAPVARTVETPSIITPESQRPPPPPSPTTPTLSQAANGAFDVVPEVPNPATGPASGPRAAEISTTITPELQRPSPTPSPTIHALVQAAVSAFSAAPGTRPGSPMPGAFTHSPTNSVSDLSATQIPVSQAVGNAVGSSAVVVPKPRRGAAGAIVQALVRSSSEAVGALPRAQAGPYQDPISRETSPAPFINVHSPQSPSSSRPVSYVSGTETVTPGLLAPEGFLRKRSSESGLKTSLYLYSSSPNFGCSSSTEDFVDDISSSATHTATASSTSLESRPSSRFRNQSKPSPLDTSGGVSSTETSRPPSASPSPSRRSIRSLKETAWGGLVAGLKVLDKCTKGCPAMNEFFKAMGSCVDTIQESERNRKEYTELARNLSEMVNRLAEHHKQGNMTKMSDCTLNLTSALQAEIDHIMNKQKRGVVSRIAEATDDREDLVERYRRIEMLFTRLTYDVTLGAWTTTHEHLANTRLDGLTPAKQAWYDCSGVRRRACTPNTRQQILTELKNWANDANSPKIFWLNGMAGTGKTTIAYSFCSELEHQLGASFFCCRTLPECRDMARIIPTIAYQLARSSLPFQHALCEVLGNSPDTSARGIPLQFEKLVRDPLLKVKNALPPVLVVVIDALDECAGHDGAQPVLDALIQHAKDLPLKFFVTSRPEPGVHSKLGSQDSYTRSVMHLHDIEESLVQTDIETYLNEELGDIPESSEKVKVLASRAKNLFIYAATAVRYIKPHGLSIDHHERLDTVLEVHSDPGSSRGSKKHEEIDALYNTILTAALADPRLEPNEAEIIRDVLSTVICAREPMNAEALAGLLKLPNKRKVELSLEPLRSVLYIPDSDGPVSTLHKSFPDYMLNSNRSRNFFCDRAVHSVLMVRRCFEIMTDSLRFNICGLESSFKFDEDVPDLQKRIDDAISPQLFYACRYWGDHLEHANSSPDILALLDAFLSQQLLFWMEVLNLKRCVGAGGRILLQAYMWLEACQASDQIRNLVLDARKFVVTFGANSASRSTPHIYVSALPFWSTTDPVWQIYGKRTQDLIKPQGTAMERRDKSNVAVWTLASRVMSIAVASDGARIVSGSDDFLVRIWDLRSGNLAMDPLAGHTGGVVSVAFSPDNAWVASGSNDYSVRIWDSQTGRMSAGPLKSDESCVTSVAFSPCGNRVVSGSLDNSVRVWDIRSGELVAGPFKPHTNSIKSLAFSPQGVCVASGSDDCTVRVWDSRNESVVAGPFQAHGKPINSVAFSPDGALVASGANDHSICIWDAKRNGAVPKMAFNGHTDQVTSVSFSPNGAYVVSGSGDRTVRVWSLLTRDLAAGPFKGHTDTVTSVAFAPDGICVVSGSHDKTIRIWDLRSTSTPVASLDGHTDRVCSVAFSPDGNRFISCSHDSTIRIWDARSGATVTVPFVKAGNARATSVSFSPKGSRVVLGFSDGVVCIRDSQSGRHQVDPFTGHTGWITSVGFSPNGHRIISSSSEGDMYLWSARTGRILFGPLQHASGSPIRSTMFSPDGKRVVSSSDDGTICLWDVRKGQRVEPSFNGHTNSVRSVAFSPGSNYIVSGSDDCTIRIWDARTGMTAVGPLQGHTGPVSTVAFSLDGALVASGSHDHTVRVWDAKSGALTAVLKGHTGHVNSIAFSPNSAQIVSGSSDLAIRLWDARAPSGVADVSKDWTMGEDGWVIGRDKEVLVWVPNDLRTGLMRPQNPMIVYRRGSLQLNPSNALIGERWQECYVR
ncbi:hypothetical protein FRC08_011224 [Ceratobasidium sp. 394]|nr:hypothetical protein FRC08_011224 [Ceratobasidium sp. 394]